MGSVVRSKRCPSRRTRSASFPCFDAPDSIIEHHNLGAVDGESCQSLFFRKPVSHQKCTDLPKILDVLTTLVGLDADGDPRIHELLHHVVGMRVTIEAVGEHRADDGNDIRFRE